MGRLLLYWDPEIDSAFRRRLERALGELHVDYADAGMVDPDPDERKLMKMALVSVRGGFAPPQDSDLIVLAGPGEFPETRDALRLEASDIEYNSKRWTALLDRLSRKMGRSSLVVAPEDLAIKLDEATRRADGAERMRAEFELQKNNATRESKQAQAALASAQAQVSTLQLEVDRLTALTESTVFSLSHVKDDLKAVITSAREHAWRARVAAARAVEMAEAHADALNWPKAQASNAGETRNKTPHGHGVIVFRKGAEEIARYAGALVDGRREGHGVATSEDGMIWCGEMKEDEACGFGILEASDGRRFEGEVAPDADGAPRQVRGHQWDAKAAIRLKAEAHRQLATALPSPRAAGG
jgi:hypothetical protein